MTMLLNWSDVVATEPAIEPVSLLDAKRNADAESSKAYDRDFKRWITAARKQVEHDARRSLITQTRTLTLDRFPSCDFIRVPHGPLQSVTSVQYVDTDGTTTAFASSKYTADTAREAITLAWSEVWPTTRSQRDAVTVTYVAGYGSTVADVPESAIDAMLLLITHRYENPYPAADRANHMTQLGYDSLIQQLNPGTYP